MIKALPKWLMEHYAKLWDKFEDEQFTHKEVEHIFKIKNVSNTLSKLKKAGWLEISLDKEDSRRSVYKLKAPEKALKEIAKIK